jgi:uncharacterized membrane protein
MLVRSFVVFDQLPSTIASHYGPNGHPDGWSGRTEFFVLFWLVLAVVVGSLLGSAVLMKHIPARYLNLPHKEYWLQEGRLELARAKMEGAMWWMCASSTLLCTAVLELVIQSNLNREPLDSTLMWLVLGSYFVFTLVWTGKLLLGFSPPDGAGD